MRWLRLATLPVVAALALLTRPAVMARADGPPAVSFEKDITPIVGRCRPCHFAGGSMYARLPFDQAQTIRKLGTRLFTRIKDEKERSIVTRFLGLKPEAETKESHSPQTVGR